MTNLFNMELLCFIPRNKLNSLFKKQKKFDINDNTNKLFIYFSKYWLGKRYPIKLWNYYDRLHNASNNSLSKYITTNNLNENINKFLNLNVKEEGILLRILKTVLKMFIFNLKKN